MYRLLIVLAVAGLLAACTSTGGSSAGASGSASGVESAAASGEASGTASAACAEAFAPLAEMGIESTSDLGELDEVGPTIESCESVADWIAGAQDVVAEEVNPATAELLLGIECADPSVSSSAICQELASS